MNGPRHDERGRPVIGLVGDSRPAHFGAWRDIDVCLAWSHYIDAISRSGGAALIAPPESHLAEHPELLLDRIDGLLLTGGRDLVASGYGAEPHPANELGDRARDDAERALATEALDRGLPILGVCRGMQLLNQVAGGGIDQHLEDPDRIHRGEPGEFVTHSLEVVAGTRLESIIGPDPAAIRSHHHQGLADLGAGLTISARAPDGLVEAVERDAEGFCLAVLWHPEEDLEGGGLALYEALVTASSERRERVAA